MSVNNNERLPLLRERDDSIASMYSDNIDLANLAAPPRTNSVLLMSTPVIGLRGVEEVDVAVPGSAQAFTAQPEVSALLRASVPDDGGSGAGVGAGAGAGVGVGASGASAAVDDNDVDESGVPSEEASGRVLKWYHLVMLLYFWTCGGPFGFEPTVQAAGPLAALVGLPMIAVFWATPQILMSAELSLAINDNGGQFQWALRAFGPFVSWMNGYNLLMCSFISQGLTTTLVLEYSTLVPASFLAQAAIKLGIALLLMVVNLLGAKAVSLISIVSTPAILGCFVVLAIVAGVRGSFAGFEWQSIVDDHPTPFFANTNWGLYFSTLVWCFGGFDSIGSAAGEVAGGVRSFVCAFVLTIPLVMANYALPVVVGYAITREFNTWTSGYFSAIGAMVAPGVGIMMIVAAVVCSAASLNAAYVPTSRVIWASARQRGRLQLFPRLFSYSIRVGKTVVPFTATMLAALMTWLASLMPYDSGVQLYLLFRLVNLAIEFASLVRLRFTEPNMPRPFKIRGGVPVCLLLCVPVAAVYVLCCLTIPPQFHYQMLFMEAVFVFLYWLRVLASMCHVRAWRPSSMAAEDAAAAKAAASSVRRNTNTNTESI
jgi:amino acid transporter